MASRVSFSKRIIAACVFSLALLAGVAAYASADGEPPRQETQVTYVNRHTWWLLWWKTGVKVCDVAVDHEILPTSEEVYRSCGEAVYLDWMNSHACPSAATNPTSCEGLYLRYAGVSEYRIEELVDLPRPAASAIASNCRPGLRCSDHPEMMFSGYEPLSGHQILELHILFGSEEIVCPGSTCLVRLPSTGERGIDVTYWAVSSYGDQTEPQRFRVRNRFLGAADGYRFDTLGGPWERFSPYCAVTWDTLPPSSGVPYWLEDVSSPAGLDTWWPLEALGNNLVWFGYAQVSLNPIWHSVSDWQNAHNPAIFQASVQARVPAKVVKGIIAQESQFWPISDRSGEHGYGRVTLAGADMLLAWNPGYFQDVCEPTYGYLACQGGYFGLDPAQQRQLQYQIVNASSPDDPTSDAGIDIVAQTLAASCAQTGQMVRNITGLPVMDAASYEDMWRLSIANYHVGAGCMGDALRLAWGMRQDITWPMVSSAMASNCGRAGEYVQRVLGYAMTGP